MFPGNPIPQQCGLRAPRIFSFRGMYGIFVGAVIFVLDASENTEYEGRETVVKITGLGDTSVEVNVSQAQKDRLETTSDLMVYVPLEGADIEIPIIANDMASMYRKLYSNPDGMTCVICGSFDPDSLLAAAVPLFGTMESAGSPNAMGESHFSLPSQKRMLEFPQVNDSQISFDYLQFGHYEPSLKNTLKLKLVRDVIRDRLITVLRERESLVYSPYISLYSKVFDDGIYYFDINAAVSPENTAKAIEVIDTILEDLQKNKISRKELSTLQRTFIVNKRNHLEEESTTNWKNYLVDEIKLGEKLEDIEEYERVLGSISPAELREAFREYIDRDRFIILSLGEFNMD